MKFIINVKFGKYKNINIIDEWVGFFLLFFFCFFFSVQKAGKVL